MSDDSEDEIQDSTKEQWRFEFWRSSGIDSAPKKKLNDVPTITTTVISKKKKKIEEEEIEEDQEQSEHSNITIFGNLDVAESRKLDAATSSSTSSIKMVSSAPQVVSSTPLPKGWHEATDPSSGDTYYYNSVTKETSWDRPTEQSTRKRPRAAISTGVSSADRHIASQIGVNMADIQEVDIRSIHDPPLGVLQLTVAVRRRCICSCLDGPGCHLPRAEFPEQQSARINFTLLPIMLVLKLRLLRSAELVVCATGLR